MTTIEILHETFVRELPELEVMAKAYFRGIGPEARDEAIQNTTCLAWKYWLRLADQGRDGGPGVLRNVWWFALKQTRVGRMITRGDGKRGRGRQDAFDRPHGTSVEHIDFNFFIGDMTPVPDQVAFRIDFTDFLDTLNERQRAMAVDLASGMGTGEVAKRRGVTPGAVSQFRTRFKMLLERFYADAA
jgi:hypothetical protein